MGIGENLKQIREKSGITQKELANKAGITQSMLCQLERGTKILSLPLAKELSELLNCHIDEFYSNERR